MNTSPTFRNTNVDAENFKFYDKIFHRKKAQKNNYYNNGIVGSRMFDD